VGESTDITYTPTMCLEVDSHPSFQSKKHLHWAVLFPDVIRVRYARCVVHGWSLSI